MFLRGSSAGTNFGHGSLIEQRLRLEDERDERDTGTSVELVLRGDKKKEKKEEEEKERIRENETWK